ncbi:aprataxin [Thrips palmi]|uniref:Aprataxin n=1 Tax=Thrips palmi TaxID=161013 RepID=A0A6P9A0Y1_THRPL|nr:aprataxin [Thrips palmi]
MNFLNSRVSKSVCQRCTTFFTSLSTFTTLMSLTFKRKNDEEASNPPKKPASASSHWANGLLGAMNDPNLRIYTDSQVVVIKDKYPKARFHYLVLPKESISSLKAINRDHLDLLEHIHHVACDIAQQEEHKNITFKMGYHAEPSMNHLHLHLISDDFCSECLKTKKHYNSFTTDHFVDSLKLIESVKKTGKAITVSHAEAEKLLKKSLVCFKCGEEISNMPKLKQHLARHASRADD